MKVRIFGFEWEIAGEGISFSDFCQYLQMLSGREVNNRILAMSSKGSYLVGVFLTIKNLKAFCKIQQEGGAFKILPQELEEGSRMADFNFFIVHPETGKGLYQHYHQSPASNTFCGFIRGCYHQVKKERMDGEILAAGEDAISDEEQCRIQDRYDGDFKYSTIIRPESFEECVRGLRQIKEFSFELMSISEEEKTFTPASEFALRCSHRLIFRINAPLLSRVKRGIVETVSGRELKRARVTGIDKDGADAVYKLLKDYATFEEFDFNDLVRSVELDSGRLAESVCNSPIIDHLLGIARRPQVRRLLTAASQ